MYSNEFFGSLPIIEGYDGDVDNLPYDLVPEVNGRRRGGGPVGPGWMTVEI